MVGKTKPILKADRERFEKLHAIGCICAHIDGRKVFGIEVHHLLSGGRRRGHQFTIPLSPWAHREIPLPGYSRTSMFEEFGPSLAMGSKTFHAYWGSDDELLALTNSLL